MTEDLPSKSAQFTRKDAIVVTPQKREIQRLFVRPLSYRPSDAATVLGVSRVTIYEMIADGRLEARKLGRATVIPHESLAQLLASAELAEATKRVRAQSEG